VERSLLASFFPLSPFFIHLTQLTRLFFSKPAEITKLASTTSGSIAHLQLFLRENRHAAGISSRYLRDIIPRGARPGSSINASALLTLPRTRGQGESLARFSCRGERAEQGEKGLRRDISAAIKGNEISCNYRRAFASRGRQVEEFISEADDSFARKRPHLPALPSGCLPLRPRVLPLASEAIANRGDATNDSPRWDSDPQRIRRVPRLEGARSVGDSEYESFDPVFLLDCGCLRPEVHFKTLPRNATSSSLSLSLSLSSFIMEYSAFSDCRIGL